MLSMQQFIDPQTGLLYVNSNEIAWLFKLVPRSDASLHSASCHGVARTGSAMSPSLLGIASRRSRDQILQIVREGSGRMSGLGRLSTAAPSTTS
ncbi:MAG: hypothetical protein P3C10_14750 [Gemmatimonadota bacterium]|nr:hypothetical protein [Gemmatimonadota bacterium]